MPIPYPRSTRSRSPALSSDTPPEGLYLLNRAPSLVAEAALRTCCGSHRWARRVAAHRPYPTVEALLAAADEAAYDLTSGDLAEALAGEATTALPDRGGLTVHTALRAANAAYEAKFGHAFVIALTDLDDPDDPAAALDLTLASLRQRLGHDEDEESVATAEQLRRICRARLLRLADTGGHLAESGPRKTPAGSPDRAGSITPGLPRGPEPTSRRYDGRGRWTVPGRA
ncbi:2-oxo-4-hydroxy-4-carboxy-5-ureidoimidazoline decarboxylase [Streptomyces sp. NPDC088197]|uniref:2-oxo-4-hydroxy-4-carboxy-5-ureidoimidazoline decarboxylase n=1 Tax=unclassified Streptomyces TaxID=2593676 RepID=UPI00339F62B8